MPNSLFIEQHENGFAFYINGDLQFDTADETVYHEYLVVPAIALALQRFKYKDLRVLICGGGDGLAARDVLRFAEVKQIDLVDYNPEVLELGKTVFKPYNGGSLESDRVTVHTQEAFEFISAVSDNFYHIVIADFTYPTCAEDTSIYSLEWFQQVKRVLHPEGIFSTNGVSPENRNSGFWCLYQTILAAELIAKPLQLAIPSFRENGYGNWGFFLASPELISRREIETLALPDNLDSLTLNQLLAAFVFKSAIANSRHSVKIHTLDHPQLFYYLLNPSLLSNTSEQTDSLTINFLDIQELSTSEIGDSDLLQLESTAKFWIEHIYQNPEINPNSLDLAKLLPVRHRYHSPNMTAEWVNYIKQLLAEIDISRLLNSLLERAQELPPQIASELKEISEKIRTGQKILTVPAKVRDFMIILSVTVLVANLANPDSVFAKGFYSSSSGSSGSGNYSTRDDESGWQVLGFLLTAGGFFWLVSLLTNSTDDNE